MTMLSGVVPIVPTAFTRTSELDPVSQRRAVDYLIDAGAHGLCILANFSEQFALSDAERDEVMTVVLDHVAGRVPVIVTTSHFSSRVAAMRSRDAQRAGAAMVMLMPPYHGATLRVGEGLIREAFATVAEAIDIPIMVQDAPMSGTPLSAESLASLAADVPQVRCFKVETGVVAAKIRQLRAAVGETGVSAFDGEESITLIPDLEAGASGTMPGGTTVDALRRAWGLWQQGRRDEAAAEHERVLPLIVYENKLCGLGATKALMAEGGILASDQVRHPSKPLPPEVRAGLVALARRLDLLVLRWAHPG